jgi:hypothetical protein
MIALDPVFNDLSRLPLAEDLHAAGDRMIGLLEVLAQAPEHGLGGSLRIPEDFYLTEIASNFRLWEWVDHNETPHEQRDLLLALATSTPFMKGSSQDLQERAKLGEYAINGAVSEALQAAHLMELPLVSFNHGDWKQAILHASVQEIDDEGALLNGHVTQVNFSETAHFAIHSDWIENRKKQRFAEPALLWQRRVEIFPNLDFSSHVESQLLGFPVNGELFPQIANRLFEMQRVAALGAPFDKNAFRCMCKASSQSTIDRFGEAYSFKARDGESILCHWHFNLPDGYRLYFGVRGTEYVIGYIGKHLPTTRFH